MHQEHTHKVYIWHLHRRYCIISTNSNFNWLFLSFKFAKNSSTNLERFLLDGNCFFILEGTLKVIHCTELSSITVQEAKEFLYAVEPLAFLCSSCVVIYCWPALIMKLITHCTCTLAAGNKLLWICIKLQP